MRNDRLWALLTLALLTLFVLTTGLVARDVIAARPPETVPVPVAVAETVPLPAAADAAAVDPARLADKLDDPMSQSGVVEGLSAYVVDAETHQELYVRDADEGVVPASTTKIVTAVAALHALGPDARIDTEVVRGSSPDEVILVGGGDPTLTEHADPDRYPRLASLEELARLAAKRHGAPPRLSPRQEILLARHLTPDPRLAQGQWLRAHKATAAIDLSDGLSTDLAHLCEESRVAAEIDAEFVPLAPGATLAQALHGGEDYELLFTAPAAAKFPRSIAGVPLTCIGRIVPARKGRPMVTLRTGSKGEPLAPAGWQHFA